VWAVSRLVPWCSGLHCASSCGSSCTTAYAAVLLAGLLGRNPYQGILKCNPLI